ncbi:MAG: SIR2 family protein, partial [Caulobacteraceae bacterium]
MVNAMLAGEVVFVCGAGVSAPQLPNFKDLVLRVFSKVGAEFEPGEKLSFDIPRYEEVLGSLARRLVHPRRMYEAAEEILAPPAGPDLTRHRMLLRLSRNLDNRISLVTTNFDPLFERAISECDGKEKALRASVAGQALPPPGSEDFAGVIHLHGRMVDPILGLSRTPLVLTSAEYGDAYMRSGWASRFLFDLARCKTLVLIGYSAGDAPIRYFLNILEADRERFTDLKAIYAFDDIESDQAEADARWSPIAVQPLTYLKQVDGLPPFGALWRDLEALADLIERPQPTRRTRTRSIFSQPASKASAQDLAELDWLLRGRGDLWDIVQETVEDPKWFDVLSQRELWTRANREFLLPAWCARDWKNLVRLHAATGWADGLGWFGGEIENLLRYRQLERGLWHRAWHLLAKADAHRARLRSNNGYFLAQRFKTGPHLDLDVQDAVNALTPHLVVEAPRHHPEFELFEEGSPPPDPQTLKDIFHRTLSVRGQEGLSETKTALLAEKGQIARAVDLLNSALRSSLLLAIDAELITPKFDAVSAGLPSIAEHAQNAYHDGIIHLVSALTAALPDLAKQDVVRGRRAANEWR